MRTDFFKILGLTKKGASSYSHPWRTNQMTPQPTLDQTVALYIRSLVGRNTSDLTSHAYQTDLTQFVTWITANDATVVSPAQVERTHITDYLSHLVPIRITRQREKRSSHKRSGERPGN